MNYPMILEVLAWIATPLLISAIFVLREDADLAVYILTNKERQISEEGAKQHVKYIQRKGHYVWIIPLLVCCVLWLSYRQIYTHPSETLFGIKLLLVGFLLVAIVASVLKLNFLINLMHGKEKEETESRWKEVADDYTRLVGEEMQSTIVSLGKVQKSLKSTFLFFVGCLFFTGFMIWYLFFSTINT